MTPREIDGNLGNAGSILDKRVGSSNEPGNGLSRIAPLRSVYRIRRAGIAHSHTDSVDCVGRKNRKLTSLERINGSAKFSRQAEGGIEL